MLPSCLSLFVQSGAFIEGQPINGRYREGETCYPGVISKVLENGSYKIKYDDGEEETGVKAGMLQSQASSVLKRRVRPVQLRPGEGRLKRDAYKRKVHQTRSGLGLGVRIGDKVGSVFLSRS